MAHRVASEIARKIVECFRLGGKVLVCGCGGSAAMSQEMAAELMGKFEKERDPLPAIALTVDTSFITAWSNDASFESVFARQIKALAKKVDVVIAFSTSGKSPSVLKAIDMARMTGAGVIDFPRNGKGTADIQEKQHKLMHDVCRIVEREMFV